MTSVIYAAIIGAVVGAVWGLALGVSVITALLVGVIVGAALGALLGFVGGSASRGGVSGDETMAANGMILGGLSVFALGAAVVVWIVRLIFF